MAEFFDPYRRYFRGATECRSLPGVTGLLDWIETPESHIFKLNIPGYKKNEIEVVVGEGSVLRIKAQRMRQRSKGRNSNAVWHVAERGGGNREGEFSREIELPGEVNLEQIKASVENNVLTIILPKDSLEKPFRICKDVPLFFKTKKKWGQTHTASKL